MDQDSTNNIVDEGQGNVEFAIEAVTGIFLYSVHVHVEAIGASATG